MREWRFVTCVVIGIGIVGGTACSAPAENDRERDNSTGSVGSVGSGGSGSTVGSGGSTSPGAGSGSIVSFAGVGTGTSGGPGDCVRDEMPYCGDGMVNQTSEACDDGNAVPGDGCTGVCAIEPYFDCPPTGGPCTSTLRCGDGVRSPGEACDDGNNNASDGCAVDCSAVDPGWYCPMPGMPCVRSDGVCGDARVQPGETCDDGGTTDGDGCTAGCRVEPGWRCTQPGSPCVLVPVCGNGTMEGADECDDGNTNSADGCSSTCRQEPGFVCATPGTPCRATVCADGMMEGSECCDDGNVLSFDGCTPDCRCEPECPVMGACTSQCGNGIIETAEVCDDGNTASSDGCSATCQPEMGFTCTTPECQLVNGLCTLTVPVVYRDFNGTTVIVDQNGTPGTPGATPHPDFQPGYNSEGVVTGLVQPTWDMDRKPVQSATAGPTAGFMHGQAAFAQWYRSPGEPGATGSVASAPIAGSIVLYDNEEGGFVNRWGANGEQWAGNDITQTWCSNTDCADPGCAAPPANQACQPCTYNVAQACYATAGTLYDGNPLFFPLDPPRTDILTEPRMMAKVPEQYGWVGWPWESDVGTALGIAPPIPTATAPFPSATHNFSFTTEVKWWFRYDAAQPMTLEFTGDDDVWVFVNGRLAVDLGSWHVPVDGTVTVGPATAATYGLTDGSVYQIGIFQAEREREGSTFKLTLSGFSLQPSDCVPACGDGVVTVGEECDLGATNSDEACGACRTDCTFGPRCGDGIVQAECTEACDDGVNIGGYNQCGVGCTPAERCGDGIVQTDFGELCDDGVNDGTACNPDCGVPAFCGDGVIQPSEECDDGINDNSYGGCSSDCLYGPRCGDSVVQMESGEACDTGPANSDEAYGGCTTRCEVGPHCGDGIRQGPEECDGGGTSMVGTVLTGTGCDASNSICDEACHVVPIDPPE